MSNHAETSQELQSAALQTVPGGTGQMFDAIAPRYDLLNRILSMGQDQYWRRQAVRALAVQPGDHILDVATGTGDLAIMIARNHPTVRVDGVDPSANMIAIGNTKVAARAVQARVELRLGDGQDLPYDTNTLDGAIVAFGIRNFPNRLLGLQEMTRVTRPGRRVVVLELSEPRAGIMSTFARAYIHHIVPRIGSLLSGQKEYRYLQQSIAAFPPDDAFIALMQQAGLTDVTCKPLSFGAVNLFCGTVLK